MYMNKQFSFTVNVFDLNDDAVAFHTWFLQSKFAEDFEVSISESDGEEVLEIVQNNPFFTVDALEEVYRTLTGQNKFHSCEDCQEKAKEETDAILEKVKQNTNLN